MNLRPPFERNNPYCAFRSDKERLRALVSRDIRLVALAAAAGIGYGSDCLRWIVTWLA